MFQIILLALAFLLVAQWWQKRHIRQVVKQFKTDFRSFPFIGSAHIFIGDGEKQMRMIEELGRQAFKYGGWSGIWIGHFHAIVADPIEAENVMKNHLEKADILKVLRDVLGDASLIAPVAIWKPHRKILMLSFKQRNLNEFMNVFSKQSSILVHHLSEVANGKRFSIWNYISSYAMDVACHATLGVDIGDQKGQDHPFPKSVREYFDVASRRMACPWLHNDSVYKYLRFWDMYSMSQKCIKGMNGFVLDNVHSKQAELKHKELNEKCNNSPNNKIDDDNNDEPKTIKPFLELLIENSEQEKGYTDTELMQEIIMILGAGTDTSAVSISFIAMMLANHPDVQEKVYKELKEIYGDSDRLVTTEDILQMHYLEMVIKETLRLYPPVPITARKIVHDDVTPAGIKLVPGISVIINHWAIQRNPKYWGPDADLFRPERFADCPPTQPSAFMPFSFGPRNCVGEFSQPSRPGRHSRAARLGERSPPSNMQCYICVTYMIILSSAHPVKDKELTVTVPHKRSLFRDVIESLRIRAQLPEDLNQNNENNLSPNYDRYGYDSEPAHLPSDADFIPRRNDRIEMPSLKYRFPKSLSDNATDERIANITTEEIVVFIDTNKVTKTTQKPKKQKRPQPGPNRKPPSKNKENDEIEQEEEVQTPSPILDNLPFSNYLSGQSQIGHRESQTVVKPTVIVNFRGTLNHRDSDIRLEGRTSNDTTDNDKPQNIFNINQEVNFVPKKDALSGKGGITIKGADVTHEFNFGTGRGKDISPKVEEDMIMCETATWNPKRNFREGRKLDSVLQILFSI